MSRPFRVVGINNAEHPEFNELGGVADGPGAGAVVTTLTAGLTAVQPETRRSRLEGAARGQIIALGRGVASESATAPRSVPVTPRDASAYASILFVHVEPLIQSYLGLPHQ